MADSPPPKQPRARRLKAAGITFIPARAERIRHDGWTPARQRDFLAALYGCGVVATAAKAVEISAKSAYRLRKRPGGESFAAAWDKLLRESRNRAHDMAIEAALTQSFVPRTYHGLFTGAVTANNERMILSALRASGIAKRSSDGARPLAALHDFLSGKGHQ